MKSRFLISISGLLVSLMFLAMGLKETAYQDPWEVPAKYQKMKNPYANASDDEQIGRILYAQHCKSCHGTKGKGDGKKAASIDTPIGDFTQASFKAQSDGEIFYKSFIGRDDMPNFEKKIRDEEEQWLLVNYIKGL